MKYEKRTTVHISQESYDKTHAIQKQLGVSNVAIMDSICDSIAAGHYDYMLGERLENFRSVAIHQSNFQRAKEHIRDTGMSMSEIINLVIQDL